MTRRKRIACLLSSTLFAVTLAGGATTTPPPLPPPLPPPIPPVETPAASPANLWRYHAGLYEWRILADHYETLAECHEDLKTRKLPSTQLAGCYRVGTHPAELDEEYGAPTVPPVVK